MKTMEDFRRYYDTELLPVVEGLEKKRKSICARLTTAGIAVGGLALGLAALFLSRTGTPVPAFIAAGVGVALIALLWWWLTKDFCAEFKDTLVRRVVTYCDPSLQYSPQEHITQAEFVHSTLFQHGIDRFRGEDLVQGQVGKTAIRFSELHAQYKTTSTDSKGRRQTHWHTIFKGLFFIADFNKDFRGRTVVLPDTAERLFGRLGKKLQGMNLARADLIKMEDPEFEREFVVYGTDQVESRYILSTSLMQRILAFRRQVGVPLHLAFVASNVCIALPTRKNMFEPRIFRSLLDFGLVAEYLEDLQLATGIVEDLNLNTRIWTKE